MFSKVSFSIVFLTGSLAALSQVVFEFEYATEQSDYVAWMAAESASEYYILVNTKDGDALTASRILRLDQEGALLDALDFPIVPGVRRYLQFVIDDDRLIVLGTQRNAYDSCFVNLQEYGLDFSLVQEQRIFIAVSNLGFLTKEIDIIDSGYRIIATLNVNPNTHSTMWIATLDQDLALADSQWFFDDDNNFITWGTAVTEEATYISHFSYSVQNWGYENSSACRILKITSENVLDTIVEMTGTAASLTLENALLTSGSDEFLIGGRISSAPPNPDLPGDADSYDLGIFRLDVDLQVIDSLFIYDGSTQLYINRGCEGCLKEDEAGNVLLASTSEAAFLPSEGVNSSIRLVKTNPDLDVIWDYSYGGDANYVTRFLEITDDGGYLLGAWKYVPGNPEGSGIDALVLKIGSDGLLTSVDESPIEVLAIGVGPNPVVDFFTIHTSLQSYGVHVYNMSGALIYSGMDYISGEQIDTSSWARGSYLLVVLENDRVIYRNKIIKS